MRRPLPAPDGARVKRPPAAEAPRHATIEAALLARRTVKIPGPSEKTKAPVPVSNRSPNKLPAHCHTVSYCARRPSSPIRPTLARTRHNMTPSERTKPPICASPRFVDYRSGTAASGLCSSCARAADMLAESTHERRPALLLELMASCRVAPSLHDHEYAANATRIRNDSLWSSA